MILALDVGNSQLFGGVFEDSQLRFQFRRSSHPNSASDELGVFLRGVLRENNLDPARRNAMLVDWENAPSARLAHPREDHLLPLMVAAGAAGSDTGKRVFVDEVASVAMASYVFG